MKTKQLFAILVAILMLTSIATASFFGDFANMLYNRAEPSISNTAAAKENTGILASNRQLCTANADCTSGTCTSCKCVANIEAVTPSLSIPAKTPTVTAAPSTQTVQAQPKTPTVTGIKSTTAIKSLIAMPTGKAIAISLPSASTLTASKTVTASTPKANGITCTSAADCQSGYCKTTSASSSPTITKQCAACNLNSQCGTGKVCIVANSGVSACLPIQAIGGVCNENSDCASNNCADRATMGATILGHCAAGTASASTSSVSAAALSPGIAAASPTLSAANEAEYTTCLTECKGRCRTECGTASAGLTAATGNAISLSSISTIKPATAVKTTTTATKTATTTTDVQPTATTTSTCVSTCDAKCETDCRASSTPAKIANNEACNNPAHCENQCESGKYECTCEGNAILAAGTEVQAQTKPETVEAAILTQEMQMQETPIKINLAPVEAKQASFERKAIADEIVTAEEIESLSLNYNLLSDEQKLENLEARYNLIIDALLEDSTLTDAQKAELREARIAAQTATAAITPTPKVNVGFFRQLGNLFTGKVVFTGYNVADTRYESVATSTSSTTSSTSSTTTAPPSAADIAEYKSTIRTMDTDLLSIETRLCNKFKEAGFNLHREPECTRNADCGTTGLMTCQTGDSGRKYCKFDLDAVCPDPDSALTPSGASLSGCSNNKQCASGLCRIRGATPDMPTNFCWCTGNEDCLEGYACDTATGVCAASGSASTGGTSSTTPPPTLAPTVIKNPTLISRIGSIFTGGRI